MGVIIKQSFWGTFISYIGVLVGYVNTLYLRPEFFSMDQIGLFSLIPAHAMLISPFCNLGMASSFLKHFPYVENIQRNQLFTLLIIIVVMANSLVAVGWFASMDWIASFYQESAPEYIQYLFVTLIIIVANSIFDLFFSYSRSILKVIFPSFLRDIFLKTTSMLLVVGYATNLLSFEEAVKGLAVNYVLALALLITQLVVKHKLRLSFQFSWISGTWTRRIFNFAAYSMLMAGSFAVLNNITYNQITSYLGTAANGIFTTAFFIGVIVEMPRRNMAIIVGPVISSAFGKKDMDQVTAINRKGSITMAVIGSLLFIGIVTNINDLFNLIPKGEEFSAGFGVTLGVCIAKLTMMVAGFPGQIINFSKFYRYNLLFQAIAALLLLFLNRLLIPSWGLNGAAVSYSLVIVLYTTIQLLFLWFKLKIHPFQKKHLYLFLIGTVVFLIFYFVGFPFTPVVSILLRSALTTVVFVSFIYGFKISPDINNLIHVTLAKLPFLKRFK